MSVRSTYKNQVPPLRFPQKLWKIANECQSGAVTWSPHGKSVLLRYSLFKGEFMSRKSEFFKTDNISSFVRQLNLYGFRKIYDHTDKQSYKANPDLHEFSNLYFQRDRPELLEKVIRKSGILKEKNEINSENQCFLDFDNDSCFETKGDDENSFEETSSEEKTPQLSEKKAPQNSGGKYQVLEDENQPYKFTPNEKNNSQINKLAKNQQVKKKCEKKRKYIRASKPEPLFPLSKFPLKPCKDSNLATLKHPELYPSLIDFNDEVDDYEYPYLRNTSKDVMWSSTLPFQESSEYQELKETYVRLHHETRMRSQPGSSSMPLNLLYSKIPLPTTNKIPLSINNKMLLGHI